VLSNLAFKGLNLKFELGNRGFEVVYDLLDGCCLNEVRYSVTGEEMGEAVELGHGGRV
jgi:hypothetical protein